MNRKAPAKPVSRPCLPPPASFTTSQIRWTYLQDVSFVGMADTLRFAKAAAL